MDAAGDAAHPALDGGVHPPPLQGPPRSVVGRLVTWVRWFGVGRLVAAAVSVLVVLVGGWWLVHPPAAPVEAALPRAGAGSVIPATLPAPAGAPSRSVPVSLVVHVAGAVRHPGVYAVPPGARVIDAIALAGGSVGEADTDALNLAQPLQDGQRVLVPRVGQVLPGTALSPGAPQGPVDLNTATVDQLDALPGIGPATAAAIVAFRQANGPFSRVDDLGKVRGIGPAKLDALRSLVTT